MSNNKITISDLIKNKEEILEAKTKKKTLDLHIESLDAVITISQPSKAMLRDAVDMGDNGDKYIIYECTTEPNLKDSELQKAYGCANPIDIVDAVFAEGEVAQIAQEIINLGGFTNGVKAIKN